MSRLDAWEGIVVTHTFPSLKIIACQAWDPERHAVFLDTKDVPLREAAAGEATRNKGEAGAVESLLRAALRAGVRAADVGVISPFRSQVALLQATIDALALGTGEKGVEVLTIDRCQGRDKPALIISFVRSNAERQAGTLLRDWRRLNVALTRARCKLIMIGDSRTLSEIELFGRLVDIVQKQHGYVPMSAL